MTAADTEPVAVKLEDPKTTAATNDSDLAFKIAAQIEVSQTDRLSCPSD